MNYLYIQMHWILHLIIQLSNSFLLNPFHFFNAKVKTQFFSSGFLSHIFGTRSTGDITKAAEDDVYHQIKSVAV